LKLKKLEAIFKDKVFRIFLNVGETRKFLSDADVRHHSGKRVVNKKLQIHKG
jgi:hypothetical protein